MSLHCKLDPAQYREYQYGLFVYTNWITLYLEVKYIKISKLKNIILERYSLNAVKIWHAKVKVISLLFLFIILTFHLVTNYSHYTTRGLPQELNMYVHNSMKLICNLSLYKPLSRNVRCTYYCMQNSTPHVHPKNTRSPQWGRICSQDSTLFPKLKLHWYWFSIYCNIYCYYFILVHSKRKISLVLFVCLATQMQRAG